VESGWEGTVDSDPACTIAVVYDPSAGFVAGGGWIASLAGAYVADPDLEGKATSGLVCWQQKVTSVPTGNTGFQFQTGALDFHSTAFDWPVVTGRADARFKGSGTVNDELDTNGNASQFMLWAGDDSPDTFRIRIRWDDENGVEHVLYDNGSDQEIGGGSIIVHTK